MKSLAARIPEPQYIDLDPTSIFMGARAKHIWASTHAHHVSRIWEDVIEHHRDVIMGVKPQPNGASFSPGVPLQISLYLGDAIRCLRTSLDYLVSALAREKDIDDDAIIFPFNEKRARIEESFSEKTRSGQKKARRAKALFDLSQHYPDLEDIILNKIQPYSADDGAKPSGDLLWRVITSDSVDKHRLMVPHVSHTQIGKIEGGGLHFSGFSTFGTRINLPPGFKPDQEPDVAFNILFAEPARLAGKPVMSALIEALEACRNVIKIFEAKFE